MNIIRLQGDIEKRKGIYYEYDAESVPLGEGGMGRVFKGFCVAEKTQERTPVAVKVIYDKIPPRVIERARREAEIQLDNDNLIHMYSFVETLSYVDGIPEPKTHYYVIMELLVGVTLEDLINGVTTDQNGLVIPFAAEIHSQYIENRYAAVVRIIKPILSGLMALHDKGYIHRDIDPSNIMLTIDRKIKLIDFGISKPMTSLGSVDKSLTATGVFMGKVNYAAPELVLGDVKNHNYTTDIYALGILIYQLCTGHLPFTGTDQDILTANLQSKLPMKDVRRKDFRKIINRATEKLQTKRYSSVAELRVDIERVSMEGSDSKEYLWRKVLSFAAIALFVVGGVIWLVNTSTEHKKDNLGPKALSCEEIYQQATAFLARTDSMQLQLKGKTMLKKLVEDSLYVPAQLQYYILLINSVDVNEVKTGLKHLEKMSESDTLNYEAMFECGLTYSKDNRFFTVPATRQAKLGITYDLDKANKWLYRVMDLDTTDYKSVYWAFNNLMEKKLNRTEVSTHLDVELVRLYKLFKKRSMNNTDPVLNYYKEAIESDGVTLKVWGLI